MASKESETSLGTFKEDWNIGNSDDDTDILIEIKVPKSIECSHLNVKNSREALLLFGAKRFLVHHDYIFFPYCVRSMDDVLHRPLESRVSEIIKTYYTCKFNDRYLEISKRLAKLDDIIDVDTSTDSGLSTLKTKTDLFRKLPAFLLLPKDSQDFINSIRQVLINRKYNRERETDYTSVCFHFLKLIVGLRHTFFVQDLPGPQTNPVTLHHNGSDFEISVSARPDIVIREMPDNEFESYNVLVVQCRKYREMNLEFDNVPVPPEEEREVRKVKPNVKFAGSLKNSVDAAASSTKESEQLDKYKHLDANICRHLRKEEKKYFGLFIAQAMVEMLAWFEYSYVHKWIKGLLPQETVDNKTVRYAIGVIGFQMVFLTLGLNSDHTTLSPHIRVGKRSAMGLDLFMTRPFDMMKAADRAVVKDIVFAITS